jgi:hypothetical protein
MLLSSVVERGSVEPMNRKSATFSVLNERPGRSIFAPSSLDSGVQIGFEEWLCEVGHVRLHRVLISGLN